MQWAEENITKDVCRLNSNLASTTNTQIESGQTKSFVNRPETELISQFLVVQISSTKFNQCALIQWKFENNFAVLKLMEHFQMQHA